MEHYTKLSPTEVSASQISLELRKYVSSLEPSRRNNTNNLANITFSRFFSPEASEQNETLNDDGALYAYSETVIWRLGVVHVMVR